MFRRILILAAAFLVAVGAPVAAQDDGYGPTSVADDGGADAVITDDGGVGADAVETDDGAAGDGALPRTGSDYMGLLVPLGAGLLTVGGLILLSTRKRRPGAASPA